MVQFGDDTYNEERAIEKLFRCISEKYKQIARSIGSLLDLSMMLIEEAIHFLKVIDGDEPQPLSGPITVGGKLHLTREQWEACQGDGKKGESSPSMGDRKRGKPSKVRGSAQAGERRRVEGSTRGGAHGGAAGNQKAASDDACHICHICPIGPRSVDNDVAARPTSQRWRRRSRLCSRHTQAMSYLQWHQPQWLSSTLMSREHMPSSATAPAMARLTGGASTPAPPIT
jgi:hypothetical protein